MTDEYGKKAPKTASNENTSSEKRSLFMLALSMESDELDV